MNTSEVARLREQIELECQAIQHLVQTAAVATHRVISKKYQNLDHCYQQLKTLVSEEEALSMMVDTYHQLHQQAHGLLSHVGLLSHLCHEKQPINFCAGSAPPVVCSTSPVPVGASR